MPPSQRDRQGPAPRSVSLSSTLSSPKNKVRLTRNKKGDYKIKFAGPVAKFAGFAAAFDLMPLLYPEATPYFASGLGAATALAILWLVWILVVKRASLDDHPGHNVFEAGKRATGLRWVAAQGAAAWVVAAALAIMLFLLLYPLERGWLGGAFLVTLVGGGALMAWSVHRRTRTVPVR